MKWIFSSSLSLAVVVVVCKGEVEGSEVFDVEADISGVESAPFKPLQPADSTSAGIKITSKAEKALFIPNHPNPIVFSFLSAASDFFGIQDLFKCFLPAFIIIISQLKIIYSIQQQKTFKVSSLIGGRK
jgi:hypothetical protein